MTYNTLATMQSDNQLYRRLVACAAEQKKPGPSYEQWVMERIWDIVSAPGWAASWEYAEALGMEDIGENETVITDGAILAVIQPMDAPDAPDQELPEEPAEPVQPLPEEPIEE